MAEQERDEQGRFAGGGGSASPHQDSADRASARAAIQTKEAKSPAQHAEAARAHREAGDAHSKVVADTLGSAALRAVAKEKSVEHYKAVQAHEQKSRASNPEPKMKGSDGKYSRWASRTVLGGSKDWKGHSTNG